MKHIYTFLFFGLSLFLVPLKVQMRWSQLNAMALVLVALYHVSFRFVIYGQVVLNHGPFTQIKIIELIKQDGLKSAGRAKCLIPSNLLDRFEVMIGVPMYEIENFADRKLPQ